MIVLSNRLYFEIGKGELLNKQLKDDLEQLILDHAHEEAVNFYNTFFYQGVIPSSRQKSLLLATAQAKNQQEQLFRNIVTIFETIFSPRLTPFSLNSTEVLDLMKLLYQGVDEKTRMDYKKEQKRQHSYLQNESSSKREAFDKVCKQVDQYIRTKEIEPIFVIVSLMIDIIHMDLFTRGQALPLAMLIFYIMAMQQNIHAFRYRSFFEKVRMVRPELEQIIKKTAFQWEQGYSDAFYLYQKLLVLMIDCYDDFNRFVRDYEYDKNLAIAKTDYIENTIDKLEEVFSKEEIRARHPLISDSTINRTLKRLQEENKIRPLGKGRSAKWIKLYQKPKKKNFSEQIGMEF